MWGEAQKIKGKTQTHLFFKNPLMDANTNTNNTSQTLRAAGRQHLLVPPLQLDGANHHSPRPPSPSPRARASPKQMLTNRSLRCAAQQQQQSPRVSRTPSTDSDDDHHPFDDVYDVLHHGAANVAELLQQLNKRKELGDAAVLCGGGGETPTAAILFGSTQPPPAWLLHKWLPSSGGGGSVVLCHNMSGSALLNNVFAAYFPKRLHQLFIAGKLIDSVLAPPHHCVLALGLWKQRCVRVMNYALFDDIALAQHPVLLPDVGAAATQNYPASVQATLMSAAYALARCDANSAADALGLRRGIVRMLIEQSTPVGKITRKIASFDSASRSHNNNNLSAQATHRYMLASSFMRMWACEYVIESVQGMLEVEQISTADRPDLVFVLAPRTSCANRLGSLVDATRMVSSHLFAAAEERMLSADDTQKPPPQFAEFTLPSGDNAELVAQASDVMQSTIDVAEFALEKEMYNSDALKEPGAVLRTFRAAEHDANVVQEICSSINTLQRYIAAADCMLVQFDGTSDCLDDARVIEALERCARTFPLRMRLPEFCRVHKALLSSTADLHESNSARLALQLCRSAQLPPDQFSVGSAYVLLSRQAHDTLRAHLAKEGVIDVRTLDALRAELALERQRIQQAFHEEYMWMRNVCATTWTPHGAATTTTPRDTVVMYASSEIEALLLRVLQSNAARNRTLVLDASADLRVSWACIMGVRTLRAVGWMQLEALRHTAEAIGAHDGYGDTRLDMLLQLAELCVVVACIAPRVSGLVEQCDAAFCRALQAAAKVYATAQNRTVLGVVQRSASATHQLFCDLPALCPKLLAEALDDYIGPLFRQYSDVHCANCLAQQTAAAQMERDEACRRFVRLHSIDSAGVMQHTRAVLQFRMAQSNNAAPASMPLLRDEWLATAAAASNSGEQQMACKLPEAASSYARFARLCCLSAQANRAVAELCIRSPPHEVCKTIFV